MPAAAVIPAPIAYANAAAVKKLVVGFRVRGCVLPVFTGSRSLFGIREYACGGGKQGTFGRNSCTLGTD